MILTIALLAAAAAQGAVPAAGPASAPTSAPAPAQPAKLTAQQQFDQAIALGDEGKCIEAIAAFEALGTRLKAGTLPASIAAVRKGQCLVRIGQREAGEASIRAGLPGLRKQEAQFKTDVASALVSLGDAALARWDYAGARKSYEEAQTFTGVTHPAVIHLKLAQATMFDGGEAPLRHADAAISAVEAVAGIDKDQIAQYRTVRARILLNQGRNEEAYTELKQVLKLTGGLGLKVSLGDVAMRGDLALAAQLTGDRDKAREYLVYTGAGRIAESPFTTALNMEPPVCGAETGLQRDDFAIVDFAIEPQGNVMSAKTVYTRGSAEVAAQFARAVSRWRWDPEKLKKIPAFYLYASRIELRCTTQGAAGPGLYAPLRERFVAWAGQQLGLGGALTPDTMKTMAQSLAEQGARAGDPARQVAAIGLQAIYQPMSIASSYELLDRANTLSTGTNVPAEARNMLKMSMMALSVAWDGREKLIPRAPAGGFVTLLDDPAIAGDALAASTARIAAATSREAVHRTLDKGSLLKAVAADARLAEQHPLKQSANLALANLASQNKDFATAQSYFKATGLTEEQCAYIGIRPAMRSNGIGDDDFPDEALRMGFEGWVSLEYDIAANGRAVATRPLIAYPPFIFSDSATRSATSFRFESSYRPSGGTACNASQVNLVYRIP